MTPRDPSPRAPFDQGLFLTHFNKGREYYDAKSYDQAERELEEAYLLRPRDPKVLNLLGLIYFRQEKYEKAEEVYRKLVAESPEANTLYYNLGLIYFKLQRLEEAESAFLKALELSEENPKINFYLGSIYERQRRFPDAIYQYRQAGANIMVRRVEDKMAAATAPQDQASPAKPPKRRDDTAKFRAAEVQQAIRRRAEEALVVPKAVHPVSPVLMASQPPDLDADTGRYRLGDLFAPPPAPSLSSAAHPRIISFQPTSSLLPASSTDRTLPGTSRPESFRFLQSNLMEIEFSGKVFIKQGTIYSYSGNLTFWVKEKRRGGLPALVIITGTGRVLLTDKDREVTFMQVQEEAVFVEPSHLLACEETLTPRYVAIGDAPEPLEFLALEGTGMIALAVASRPLPLTITQDLPVSVPAASVISWSGAVQAHAVQDRQLYEVMLPHGDHGTLLRLEGNGRLMVEQSLARAMGPGS
jgi:uncharacterized protein (AIM24 family)